MEDFLTYILGFEPTFLEQVEGASPEEIETLQSIVGFYLPKKYRDFLSIMGRNKGNLYFVYDEGSTDIRDIIQFYHDTLLEGEEYPENCVLIAADGYVTIGLIVNQEETPVFMIDGAKAYELIADSFEKMLFARAFCKYQLTSFEYIKGYSSSNPENRLSLSKDIVKDFGFEIMWFSDSGAIYAQKNGAAIAISQGQIGGMSLSVGATSELEAKKIGDVFVEKTGVRFVPRQY
ncbi:MAG: SMI1/KNR4 family protein [Oscillatoria sp. SIO1A7]|nr:SMI1/KNR4 family protein [Oscillatoria sp. SIO1A7]